MCIFPGLSKRARSDVIRFNLRRHVLQRQRRPRRRRWAVANAAEHRSAASFHIEILCAPRQRDILFRRVHNG